MPCRRWIPLVTNDTRTEQHQWVKENPASGPLLVTKFLEHVLAHGQEASLGAGNHLLKALASLGRARLDVESAVPDTVQVESLGDLVGAHSIEKILRICVAACQ